MRNGLWDGQRIRRCACTRRHLHASRIEKTLSSTGLVVHAGWEGVDMLKNSTSDGETTTKLSWRAYVEQHVSNGSVSSVEWLRTSLLNVLRLLAASQSMDERPTVLPRLRNLLTSEIPREDRMRHPFFVQTQLSIDALVIQYEARIETA